MEERRAVAEILGTQEGETNPEAAQRLVDLLAEVNRGSLELSGRIAELEQGAKDGSGAHIPAVAGSTPAPASIEDDDPTDPRPAMNPLLGWNTPEVVEWANRRRNRNNA